MTDDPHIRIADMVDAELAAENPQPVVEDGAPFSAFDAGAPDDEPDDVVPDEAGDGREHVDHATLEANAALDQNDTDNGRRLINGFGGQLLYVSDIGTHVWEGRYWKLDAENHAAMRMAQKAARRIKLEAVVFRHTPAELEKIARMEALVGREDLSDEEKDHIHEGRRAKDALQKRRDARRKFAVSSGNSARIKSMIDQAMPHIAVPPAALDADGMKFNVANGTLQFKAWRELDGNLDDVRRATVELIAHEQGHRISKIAGCLYDPQAKAVKFDEFMVRFQPNRETRRFLQVAMGRALLGGALTQALIFLYGDGANGKSVFLEVMARVLGEYTGRMNPESISGSNEQAGDRATPDWARLHRKRYLVIEELAPGVPLREALIKSVTGGAEKPVRNLNKGFFDLLPEFIPFMSGNEMPSIRGVDKGIWRRMKFVSWPVTLGEGEQRSFPQVVGEMVAESAGVLNWLVEGALIFLREGLIDPPEVVALTQSHREDSDPVGAFVRDCVFPLPGGEVQARVMFNAFNDYCVANAIKPFTEKTFSTIMKKKGYERLDKRIRQWVGVRLEPVEAPLGHENRWNE